MKKVLQRADEQVLVDSLCRHATALRTLLNRVNRWNVYDNLLYKFYSQSFKVFHLQDETEQIVAALTAIAPKGSIFNPFFTHIVRWGTGRKFNVKEDNQHWIPRTAPIVQAFLHARYFLEMAVKCSASVSVARRHSLEWGCAWIALATLYCVPL